MRIRGVGQVSRCSIFSGHGKEVAPRDDNGAFAVGREIDRFEMLRPVDKSGSTGGEVLFYFNWNRCCLAAGEIVPPNIAGLLKDDGIPSKGGKLDIEILEGGELLRFLAGQIR